MKRVLTLVLALVMVCGVAVTAMAADFGIETDKDIILAGEDVTVTVSLDETIPVSEGATMLQGNLTYDKEVLTFKSITASETYSFLTTGNNLNKSRTQFSYVSMTNSATEFPAGTLVTVVYTANEDMEVAALEASFSLKMDVQTAQGAAIVGKTYEASIKICAGHTWDEGTGTPATCTEDGEVTYTCTACGATKTEKQAATGHKKSEWATNIEYITNEDGMMTAIVEEYACEYCGLVMEVDTIYCLSLDEEANLVPDDKTVEIAAGETAHYYVMGFGGYTLLVYGEDVSVNVVVNDWMTGTTVNETYTAVDGVVSVPISGWEAELYITNNGTAAAAYDLALLIPLGDMLNPQILTPGDNALEVPADCYYGFYAQYIADCSGTITFTFTGEHWNYRINNYGPSMEDWSDDVYGDTFGAHDENVVNTQTIEVKAGDIIEIIVDTGYEVADWEWEYPAATVNVNVACDYTHEGHIVHVEAKEPNCFEEGNVEYWYCENCETVWTDKELTQVSNFKSVILPVTHDIVHYEAKDATCYEDGNIEYWQCTLCGYCWLDEYLHLNTNALAVVLPAGHDLVHIEAVEPGCHFTGNVEHWYCLACETVWTDEDLTQVSNHQSVILPELGGDVIHVEAKDPTCTKDGNIEHWYCEKCEQVWQNEERTQLTNHKNVIVPAHGHVYGADGICTICGDNPKSGDATMISVVIAAALVSALTIVALPVMKKRF